MAEQNEAGRARGARQFARNPFLDRAVSAVLEVLRGMSRGDVLTHETIGAVSGVAYGHRSWGQLIRRVRRDFLAESGVEIWPVDGVGYELSTAAQQVTRNPERRARKARNQLRRSEKAVSSTPPEELTPHQQKLRLARMDAAKHLAAAIDADRRAAAARAESARHGNRPRSVE